MLQHPWAELQVLIKEKWFTQKAFSSILWKKVSEVNELLKWKRNITIQRDYLLDQTLWTPIKYWILRQIDYDYSLLNIEETSDSPTTRDGQGEIFQHPTHHSEHNEESKWPQVVSPFQGETFEEQVGSSEKQQETPAKKSDFEDDKDKDLQNRANIFRSF